MRQTILAAAAASAVLALAATPAAAQRRDNQAAAQPQGNSQLALQAESGQNPPDVVLDVPNLSVEQLTVEVNNLRLNLALDARLANLLYLSAGANAQIDNVRIDLRGVRAQATLLVRLDNVRAIIERTLQTLDNNPQIVSQLLSTVDNTVGTVGNVANNTVGTVGQVAGSRGRHRHGKSGSLIKAGRRSDGDSAAAVGPASRTRRPGGGRDLRARHRRHRGRAPRTSGGALHPLKSRPSPG
jgi:hypothetical protein